MNNKRRRRKRDGSEKAGQEREGRQRKRVVSSYHPVNCCRNVFTHHCLLIGHKSKLIRPTAARPIDFRCHGVAKL